VSTFAISFHEYQTDRQKVVVALPLYKQLSVSWFYNWELLSKEHCAGSISTDGVYLPFAMTDIVAAALRTFGSWEWLVVLEHDVVVGRDTFDRIAGYESDRDIVGAVCPQHQPPHKVMAFTQDDPQTVRHLTPEVLAPMLAAPGLYEVDKVSMSCTAINRRVLEKWDPDIAMWDVDAPVPGRQRWGHDLRFCDEAVRQGFRVWLDTAICCGHLTETTVDVRAAGFGAPSPETI
jgi:hypothetical protein